MAEPAFVTGKGEGAPPRLPVPRRGPGWFYPLMAVVLCLLIYLWVRPVAGPESRGATAVSPESLQLLEIARRQHADGRLTAPPGDNAEETLHELLRRDPQNPDAQAELRAIAETYGQWAKIAAAKGARDRARRYLERGLKVDPTDEVLHAQLRELGGE
ncbi:MAG: tetratricopeptide repeat protein [Deltaproteobacteria bacterium]|nr:tetratricopeptide repeat protein [Deltaproteobacteria bacterium]NCP96311.1 tetratricopeptide repeat protein [Deltaproteobacteria bacterium]NCS73906.1 tetratricopeptide repeat protein [Deltaproteobacteria bacterium]